MNSKSKIPSILLDKPITWQDWLAGRRARRQTSKQIVPGVVRRERSSADRRLRRRFPGERGLPFVPTAQL